jgi:hypothetical protein
MDITGYLTLFYMGIGILLGFWCFYLDQRLKRHVDIKYPEESRVIRSYEWQWYPWSAGRRSLRELIIKQSSNDPELEFRARKAKLSVMYIIIWCIFFVLSFAASVLLSLVE